MPVAIKAHLTGVARHRPDEYLAIAAWHRESGATDDVYIDNVQRRAASQGQPVDVVYEHYDRPGEWTRVSDLASSHAFRMKHPEFINA